MNNTPQINATGVYEVMPPFTLVEGAIYRCEAISRFEPLIADGVDVYERFYVPMGLQRAIYDADRINAVNIVTLTSTTDGSSIDIPSSYILSFPSSGTVPYGHLVLSANLGLVPDSLRLETLKEQISDFSSDLIGIRPDIVVHRLPMEGDVTLEQHQKLELNRLNLIQGRNTAHAENARLLEINEGLQERIELLESVLRELVDEQA